MLAGATRMKTETLPISLFLNMSCGELELAISAATILILISVVSLYIFERYGGAVRL
jgi:molybdate transport system permease protein